MTDERAWWSDQPDLASDVTRWLAGRRDVGPSELHGPPTPKDLESLFGPTITSEGLGGTEAFRIFADVLAPSCLVTDHPRFLAFVPSAPNPAASLFDATLGASAIFGGSWIEGSGSVHAENAALRWIADLARLPETARGVFVSGGCAGNMNALMVARERWRSADPSRAAQRPVLVASSAAHSSITSTARILDVDVAFVDTGDAGRLDRSALASWRAQAPAVDLARVFAVVATAGTTNAGLVDDLVAVADLAHELDAWFHVDGAYGLAAMLDERFVPLFEGVERADSVIVDPHKWLFAPFDVCALLYRDPDFARSVHTQHAEYLDPILGDASFNPSDLAYHLSRRSRGLPLWFALATYGTAEFSRAVAASLDLAVDVADLIRAAERLQLVLDPGLSVVLFRRVGWSAEKYQAWCDEALARGIAFVLPTEWCGETVLRFCFTNPATTIADVVAVLDSIELGHSEPGT